MSLSFPTRLVAEYIDGGESAERTAVVFLAPNILLISVFLGALRQYARRRKLIDERIDEDEAQYLTAQITPSLGAYAAAVVLGLVVPKLRWCSCCWARSSSPSQREPCSDGYRVGGAADVTPTRSPSSRHDLGSGHRPWRKCSGLRGRGTRSGCRPGPPRSRPAEDHRFEPAGAISDLASRTETAPRGRSTAGAGHGAEALSGSI